jgi:hypothetical protein
MIKNKQATDINKPHKKTIQYLHYKRLNLKISLNCSYLIKKLLFLIYKISKKLVYVQFKDNGTRILRPR